MESTTSTTVRGGLSRRVLRFTDGASRPVLPEEIYVDYELDTRYSLSFASTRSRVLDWWPEQGRAWDLLGDVITEHIKNGTLVMCLNTDPEDHPHHHITQGVANQFHQGERPLVLRYLTTPAGSIAWRAKLSDRAVAAAAEAAAEHERHAQEAARKERLAEHVVQAVMAGATSERAIRKQTVLSKTDVHDAVMKLAASRRLVAVNGSRWGFGKWSRCRWAVVNGQEVTN